MNKKIQMLGLCSALALGNAQAEIAFNGFANIVGGQTASSDERLYGFDDTLNFQQASLFALQATSDLGDGVGVTAQIISRGADDWDPDFEWAYLSYDATDEVRFLVGRQRVPFYMYSDYIDVSYAYPWITPPEGVYSVPFDSFDGLGMIYSTSLGQFDTTVQVIYGGNDTDLGGTAAEFDNLMGLSLTLNREWLTLRAGYIQTELTIDSQETAPLYAGWTAAGFPEVASNFLMEEDTGDFIELGFQIDYESFIVIGEYTALTLDDTPIADADSFYVMGGYRHNDLLFHVTYGMDDDQKDRLTGGVPTGVDNDLDQLIGITNGLTDSLAAEESYYTLGIRWDFHESTALKFEYTSFSDDLNDSADAGLIRTAIVTVF